MHWVQMPIHLPSSAPNGCLASLTLAATPDGDVTIGYDVRDLITKEPLALGCAPPGTQQDLPAGSREALEQLLGVLATLLDWDPFDGPSS